MTTTMTVKRAIERLEYLASGNAFMYRIPDCTAESLIALITEQAEQIERLKTENERLKRACKKWEIVW